MLLFLLYVCYKENLICDLQVCSRGELIKVKVLGILAMIDEGETDWKVIVINSDDPEAKDYNGESDHSPPLLPPPPISLPSISHNGII